MSYSLKRKWELGGGCICLLCFWFVRRKMLQMLEFLLLICCDGIIIKINVKLFFCFCCFDFLSFSLLLLLLPQRMKLMSFPLWQMSLTPRHEHIYFFPTCCYYYFVLALFLLKFFSPFIFGFWLKKKYRTHQINDSLWTCCSLSLYKKHIQA